MSVKSSISLPLWRIIIYNSQRMIFIFIFLFSFSKIIGQEYNNKRPVKNLKHHMTAEEAKFKHLIGQDFTTSPPPNGPVRNVSEFDRMQGVLIRYPFGISYAVIKEMAENIMVVTIVEDQSEEDYVLNQYNSNGVNTANCEFLHAPTNSYWTRDYGPWYIFDGEGNPGIVDFPYNRPRPLDDEIPVEMANYLGINVYGMDIIHTGGNYMTDGHGNASSSELVWEENPSLTPLDINQLMNDYLGIETYHVVPDPNNSYIDHIDCWGKFLDIDKVLIREVPPTHPQYNEIEATAAYYASQISSYGVPYEVYRVFTPDDQPYTNSLILNEKVQVPVTGSQWDDDAIQAYQDAMPGYEIIGCTGSWASTDALHCRSKGIADLGMLYINHLPLLGSQPDLPDYQIQAEITAHSNLPIYPDSVFLIYKINGGINDTILMSYLGGKTWSGILSNPGWGNEIAYYIFAADQSGRNETHPFIGEPDPHILYVGEPSYPDISVNPSSFEVTLLTNDSTIEQLSLSNLGLLELDFNIDKQYVFNKAKAYCSSSGGCDEYISRVIFNTIDNTSACSNYADYTNISTNVNTGETYSLIIENGSVYSADDLGVWIDWNQDQDFDDVGENVVCESGNSGQGTFDITIPADALSGSTVMRIRIKYYGTDCGSSCETTTFGEVEDYSLNVNSNFVDWLALDPIAGTISGQGTTNINLTFNSTGMDEGDYYADVTINCNDPNQPQIIIPVQLIVTGAGFVDLKVFLEGPFSGIEMTNDLNVAGYLPLDQPYNIEPWNYTGTESVQAIPNSDIVDWILIEYRDATDAISAIGSTSIGRQAAFLIKDGSVVDLDGTSILQFNPEGSGVIHQLFTVVWYRNHLGIMSANPVTESGGIYTYDFTISSGQAYGSL